MGVAVGVIDVFEAVIGAPVVVDHATPPSNSGTAEQGSPAR